MKCIFFGSTDDSVCVLAKLIELPDEKLELAAVVTQPAKPVGRNKTLTPTPVEVYAKKHNITVLTFETQPEKPWKYQHEEAVTSSLSPFQPDIVISASYGQKIPYDLIKKARYGGINVHPSLLPRWRGTDPVPWTILSGDAQTGVSIVTLSETFDTGRIIAQKKIPIPSHPQTAALRNTLFTLGAQLLTDALSEYIHNPDKGAVQDPEKAVYARRLTREDGYIPWPIFLDALHGIPIEIQKQPEILSYAHAQVFEAINRAVTALSPWPGIYTLVTLKTEQKRLKILSVHIDEQRLIPDMVQLEGKNPVSFSQFVSAYGISLDK
jgi:methionyl-tRNA formyltransferase